MADEDYKEGETLYHAGSGTATTLKRGDDGKLYWTPPVKVGGPPTNTGKIPPTPQPKAPITQQSEDLIKNALPATERAVTGLFTAPPTLANMGAKAAEAGAKNFLPEGKTRSAIETGAQTVQKYATPFTYPRVQGAIESAYNKTHPNDPFYYPKTPEGQFEEAGIGGGIAAMGGPGGWYRALTRPISELGGRLATGLGAGLGGEAAGQVADQLDLGPYVSEGARALGSYFGGKELAERPRKLITPNPAISPAHQKMAELLEKQPGNITTPGQYSGQPAYRQKDANLAPFSSKYKDLSTRQPQSDTSVLLGSAGIGPTAAAQGASRPLIKQARNDIDLREQTLGSATRVNFDPQFKNDIQNALSEYHRVTGTTFDPKGGNPVDRRVMDLYQGNPYSATSTRGSLWGGNTNNANTGALVPGYSTIRNDIGKEASSLKDKVQSQSLYRIRKALDDAMDRSTAGTPYEGKWKELFDQKEAASTLDKATKKNLPVAGVLDPTKVANTASNPDSKIAEIARAQSVVHKPLPEPNEPKGLLPTATGAALSYLTGGSPTEGALAGTVSGPVIAKSLLRNPITAGMYFSAPNQARLRNSWWLPGPGSTMDPATVARLLALQKTENSAPETQ